MAGSMAGGMAGGMGNTRVRLFHWERVTWPELLFALGVVAAPLALGGVHEATQIALAGVFLLSFIGLAWRLQRRRREVRVGWVGLGLLIALAWSFLQWLPWPAGLVEVLSPASWEARRAVALASGAEVPAWMPLALDAGRAAAGVVSLLAITLAYLSATSLRADSDARARVTTYVELAALGVLASAVVHHALGLQAIWGFYRPETTGLPAFVTSFVNPNHAAALMLLGAIVAFGAAMAPERKRRWHLVVGVLLAVGVLASLSRANAVLLVGALLAVTVPPLLMRRFRAERTRLSRLMAGTLCCLFVALVLIGPERWASELAALTEIGAKDQGVFVWCWSVGGALLGLAPAVGLGAGGFALASSSMSQSWHETYLAYAHNGALQVLLDLGVVVGAVVLVAVVLGWARAAAAGLRGREVGLSHWAAGVALGVVGLQNLVDFSLWIPGVGIPAAVLLGMLVESSWRVERAAASRWRWPAWRWPLWALLIPAGMLIVTAVPAHRDRAAAWRAAAAAALEGGGGAEAAALIDRTSLVRSHPHDYLALSFAAALADASAQPDEARRWLERALVLAPNDATILEAAARQRLKDGDEAGAGALIERLDPAGIGEARAVGLVLSAPWAKALNERFFDGHPRRAVVAARMLADGREPEAAERADRLLVWALAQSPDDLELARALGGRRWGDAAFLERLATTTLASAGATDDPARRAAAEALGYLFQARVEALAHRPHNAYQLYRAAARGADDGGVTALIEAGKVADAVGNAAWLDDVLGELATRDIIGAWPRGEHHLLRSRAAERSGDLVTAIREMQSVLRTLGHVPSMHSRLAALFARAGDAEAAERARARAESLSGAP